MNTYRVEQKYRTKIVLRTIDVLYNVEILYQNGQNGLYIAMFN